MEDQILKNETKQLQFEKTKEDQLEQNNLQITSEQQQVQSLTDQVPKTVTAAKLDQQDKPKPLLDRQEISFAKGQYKKLEGRHWKLDRLFETWDIYLETRKDRPYKEKKRMLQGIISWGRKWYWTSWSPFKQSRENSKAVSKVIDDAKKELDHIQGHWKVTQAAIDAGSWVGSAAMAVGKGLWTVAGFLPIPFRTEYMRASGNNTLGKQGGFGHYFTKEQYAKCMRKMRKNYDITRSYSDNRQKYLGNYLKNFDRFSPDKKVATTVTLPSYKTAGQSWISKISNTVMALTVGFVGRNLFNIAGGVFASAWNLGAAAIGTVGYGIVKGVQSIASWDIEFDKRSYLKALNALTVAVSVPHGPKHWLKYYAENVPSAMDVFHERGLLEGIRAAIHFNVYRPFYDYWADLKREAGSTTMDHSDFAQGPSHLFGGGLQTAWGVYGKWFKRIKNIGKLLIGKGTLKGALDPEREEIMNRGEKDTIATLQMNEDNKNDDDD